jgi:hypothetical protein
LCRASDLFRVKVGVDYAPDQQKARSDAQDAARGQSPRVEVRKQIAAHQKYQRPSKPDHGEDNALGASRIAELQEGGKRAIAKHGHKQQHNQQQHTRRDNAFKLLLQCALIACTVRTELEKETQRNM